MEKLNAQIIAYEDMSWEKLVQEHSDVYQQILITQAGKKLDGLWKKYNEMGDELERRGAEAYKDVDPDNAYLKKGQ